MIQLARLVPPDANLAPWVELYKNEIWEEMERDLGGWWAFVFNNRDEVYLERVIRRVYPESSPLTVLETHIEKMPQAFKDYIVSRDIDLEDMFQGLVKTGNGFYGETREQFEESYLFIKAMCKYSDFYQVRHSLKVFVSYIQFYSRSPLKKATDGKFYSDAFPIQASIRRGADGKIHLTGLASFIYEGFDDSRLRTCKKCGHIFWAKRQDSKTCSKQCLNAYNVQQYRKLTDEEKATRKQKRQVGLLKRQLKKAIKRLDNLEQRLDSSSNLIKEQFEVVENLKKEIEQEAQINGTL